MYQDVRQTMAHMIDSKCRKILGTYGISIEREETGVGHDVACLTPKHRSQCLARATRNTSLNICVEWLHFPKDRRKI